MSAADDLTELVERAAAAERAALAAKWKPRADVDAVRRKVRRAIDEHRDVEQRSARPTGLSARRSGIREALLVGDPEATGSPGAPEVASPHRASDGAIDDGSAQFGFAEAAAREAEAVAAVTVARLALLEAHLAVLDARLARIDAGEAEPEAAAVDGHVPLAGRNAVSRHGPALARGVRGEISYILTRKPRTVARSLAIGLAMGLLYLGFLRLFEWDTKQRLLPYLGLWAISVVMGGAVCINAMSFDAMRVRAALDRSGTATASTSSSA